MMALFDSGDMVSLKKEKKYLNICCIHIKPENNKRMQGYMGGT